MLGIGRPAKRPSIDGVRELSRDEVANVTKERLPAVKKLVDSHHNVARLVAMGCRPNEVALRSGYTLARISTLIHDPAFQELVASYRSSVDQSWRESVDEYYETINSNRTIAARLINEKLGAIEDSDDISFRELVSIHSDAADRTGYPKRNIAVNVNVDFASRLDQAIKRSNEAQEVKVIDNEPQKRSA